MKNVDVSSFTKNTFWTIPGTTIPLLVAENLLVLKMCISGCAYVHLLSPEGPAIRGKS